MLGGVGFDPASNANGEESLLVEPVRVSSACTGAYTAELALGVVGKTINDSRFFDRQVSFQSKSCHEP